MIWELVNEKFNCLEKSFENLVLGKVVWENLKIGFSEIYIWEVKLLEDLAFRKFLLLENLTYGKFVILRIYCVMETNTLGKIHGLKQRLCTLRIKNCKIYAL